MTFDYLGLVDWVRAEAKQAYLRRERETTKDLLAVAEAIEGPGTRIYRAHIKKAPLREAPPVLRSTDTLSAVVAQDRRHIGRRHQRR